MAKIEVDTKTFVRFWAVPIVFLLLVMFVMKAATALAIIGIALFLAIALKPLARRIDKIDMKVDRPGLSSILAVVLVVAVVLGIAATVGPMVVSETARFLSSAPETISGSLGGLNMDRIGSAFGISDLKGQIIKALSEFSTSMASDLSAFAVNGISAVGSLLVNAALVVVLTILFMLEGPEIMKRGWDLLADKNNKGAEVAKGIVTRMAEVVAIYVSKQLIVSALDGVVVATAIMIFSVFFDISIALAIPMGLGAMVLCMIPMFGQVIACILISLLLLFSSPWAGLTFLVFYIIYAQIENNLIAPKLQGKGLNLPPLVILIAITIGTYMFGLIGAIGAIPIAGCIKVLFEEYPKIKALRMQK